MSTDDDSGDADHHGVAAAELVDVLLADSLDRVTVLAPDLTILIANRVALPERRRTIVGEKCFAVFAQRTAPCAGCPAVEAFEHRAPVHVERRCSATCGRTLTVDVYPIRPHAAGDARVIQVVRGAGRARPYSAAGARPIVGSGVAMAEVHRLVDRIAPASSNVLVTGESGSGKELVARAIHERSARASAVFLPVNVAAIPRELVESHLFGHDRGSFTGADRPRAGAFRAAVDGTLFLDEIGELPLDLQAKLLRAIEEKEVFPVGSDVPVHVDVRVVAATHRDLAAMVHAGTFRQDLFYRLDVVRLHVPALRERPEDIPALVEHVLALRNPSSERPPPSVEPDALDALMRHPWPGNVRQLANIVERAMVLGDGLALRLSDLPDELRGGGGTSSVLDRATAEFQRGHIVRVLQRAGGNRQHAARLLGVSEATLYRKLEACGLKNGRGSGGGRCSHD